MFFLFIRTLLYIIHFFTKFQEVFILDLERAFSSEFFRESFLYFFSNKVINFQITERKLLLLPTLLESSSLLLSNNWQNDLKSRSSDVADISSKKSSISKVNSNSFFMISMIIFFFTKPSVFGPPPIAIKASTFALNEIFSRKKK